MKYLFFLTILFSAASAKAQLPPVRTSDPAGVQTEKTVAPLRAGSNTAAISSERTLAGNTTALQAAPLRTTDNVSNTSNAAVARTASTLNNDPSKLPLRTADQQSATTAAATIGKVPLRSSDTVGKDSATNSLQNTNATKKLLLPSERAIGDSTKTSL